jgi:hypothetical protein
MRLFEIGRGGTECTVRAGFQFLAASVVPPVTALTAVGGLSACHADMMQYSVSCAW